MITFDLHKFADSLQDGRKLIAIDLGTKTVGFAISDRKLKFVEDFFQISSLGFDGNINFLLEKNLVEGFAGVVIGMPFSHTRKNGWVEFISDFAIKLNSEINISIYMKDESFSTQNIGHLMQNFSKKAKKRWKDKLAASCMLEETLYTIGDYRNQAKENLDE